MTTPANYFRIRQTYGTAGTVWVSPSGTSFPDVTEHGMVTYPQASARSGAGVPRGAFGAPQMELPFPPLTPAERQQVMTLFSYVPSTYSYAPVEVENIDPRASGTPGWETWTGYIEKPQAGEGVRNTGSGATLFGFTLTVIGLEAT